MGLPNTAETRFATHGSVPEALTFLPPKHQSEQESRTSDWAIGSCEPSDSVGVLGFGNTGNENTYGR